MLTFDAQVANPLIQPSWQATAELSEFETSEFNLDWPALEGSVSLAGQGDLTTANLQGTFTGELAEIPPVAADLTIRRLPDNTIQVDQLTLNSSPSKSRVSAHGTWTPAVDNSTDYGTLSLNMDWQHLQWPLTSRQRPWFHSTRGSGSIEGTLNRYRFDLRTDSPWPEAPPSEWHAEGEGNLEGVNIERLHISTLDGEALAQGRLSWSPQLAWQANMQVTDINPASYFPQWPGRLSATLSNTGHLENGQLNSKAEISQLTGTLRGYPVSLHSNVEWRHDGLDIEHLDFYSGTSQFSLQGRMDERLMLSWSINANNLAELYPGTSGKLEASGDASGPRDSPTVNATINGSMLNLMEYQIGSLNGSLDMDLQQWPHSRINLVAKNLDLKGYPLESLNIATVQQGITLSATSNDLTARVELAGEVDSQGWHGVVQRADFNSQRFSSWQLKSPATVVVNTERIEGEPLCWFSNKSDLCLTLHRSGDEWLAKLQAEKLPLTLAQPLLPADLGLHGVGDLLADIRLQSAQLMGEATLRLAAGSMSYLLLDGERRQWDYRNATLQLSLDGQGIKAHSDINLPGSDKIHLAAELPGADLLTIDPLQQSLKVRAQLNISDMGLVEAFIPEIEAFKGELAVNLSADGTLSKPHISGNAQLLNGTFLVPRLGLTINKLSLRGHSDALDKLHFNLEAASGPGSLAVTGSTILERTSGWPTELHIKGDQFEVAHISEALVQVSPDLLIKVKGHLIDIKGDVHIPFARLHPRDISSAAHVSDDALIIGTPQISPERWSIFNKTRLTLGERVNFYGFGFEGRFGGTLLLMDEPGQLTRSTGEITIADGFYRAYGQRLEIERGRLLYAGGPIMNPGLDFTAVRHVGEVSSGLKVRGTLNHPQVELFSVPVMGQTNALSYLLLGRPIESASGEDGAMMAQATLALGLSGGDRLARSLGERFGLDEMRLDSSDGGEQASLVVGRYLSPKLYISYGVGLIESINTLAVRYQISDKWQLKGESGEHQGADFLYTIER